jgi:hypothetical protein
MTLLLGRNSAEDEATDRPLHRLLSLFCFAQISEQTRKLIQNTMRHGMEFQYSV